jgi:hypothetical protein
MDYAGRVSIATRVDGKHKPSDSQYVYELLAEPFDGENGDDDNGTTIIIILYYFIWARPHSLSLS